MEEKNKARNSVPAMVMVGCMFIGIAIGMLLGNISAGTLIGLGTGFIVMAILRYAMAKKEGSSANQNPDQHP